MNLQPDSHKTVAQLTASVHCRLKVGYWILPIGDHIPHMSHWHHTYVYPTVQMVYSRFIYPRNSYFQCYVRYTVPVEQVRSGSQRNRWVQVRVRTCLKQLAT